MRNMDVSQCALKDSLMTRIIWLPSVLDILRYFSDPDFEAEVVLVTAMHHLSGSGLCP